MTKEICARVVYYNLNMIDYFSLPLCVLETVFWTFLWFVCFCLLANQWANTTDRQGIPVDAAQAIIVFSFFSFVAWVNLSFNMFVATYIRQHIL